MHAKVISLELVVLLNIFKLITLLVLTMSDLFDGGFLFPAVCIATSMISIQAARLPAVICAIIFALIVSAERNANNNQPSVRTDMMRESLRKDPYIAAQVSRLHPKKISWSVPGQSKLTVSALFSPRAHSAEKKRTSCVE